MIYLKWDIKAISILFNSQGNYSLASIRYTKSILGGTLQLLSRRNIKNFTCISNHIISKDH